MHKVECPSCAQTIRLEKEPKPGQLITCSTCNTALVVTTISPLTVSWAALDDHAENSVGHDHWRKSKKHKKRYEREDSEDSDDIDDDVESFGKRRRPKRTRNLDDDYDY